MAIARGSLVCLATNQVGNVVGGTAGTTWQIKDRSNAGTVVAVIAADANGVEATTVAAPANSPAPGSNVSILTGAGGRLVSSGWIVTAYVTTPDTGATVLAVLQSTKPEDPTKTIWVPATSIVAALT